MTTTKKRIPGHCIRNTWQINPRIRIHDNDVRKNKKKARQLAQKEIRNLMKQKLKGAVPNESNQWTVPFDLSIFVGNLNPFVQRFSSRLPISFR